MQPDRIADLSEALARATALVDGLGSTSAAVEIADRPSFLLARPDNDPQPIIERLASAERLTFVVGAGASMEAGLPSWGNLVRALLEAAAPKAFSESDRVAWLDAASESGLLGMAATARALAGTDREFVARVEHHLYRGKGADQFDPGPLAREIAAWKHEYPQIQLATFNYDRLLERALEDLDVTAESREDNEVEPGGVACVRHLHGLLTGKPAKDAVILTEGDYALWPQGSWQDKFMREALDGVCVFLGLSFTDQNLLRWIYRASGSEHVAVLTRQSSPRLSADVRRELESATRARLHEAHVSAYWADFYAEVAQLMHEARRCLPAARLESRQRKVREILFDSLSGVRTALDGVGLDTTDVVLGLGLWGLDYDQRNVTLWGASDRVHVDLSTVIGVPLEWDSEWVAIEAITQGSVVESDPDVYASRWRSVRGLPLVWTRPEQRERIIVGAATLTTTKPSGSSIFDEAEEHAPGIRKTIDALLGEQLVSFWD
jgi:hypothetical protein